jgi:hypothetical protein
MDAQYHAPRFHAYLCDHLGAMLMERREWEQRAQMAQGEVAPVDLLKTPIAGVASEACVLAAVAVRTSETRVVIEVYRHDAKDALPVNVDRYEVCESFPPDLDYTSIVSFASTQDNANLRGFVQEWVYFRKKAAGPGHWLAELPPHVKPYARESRCSSPTETARA